MSDKRISLFPGQYYHIYNRAVGKENFFECERDYDLFISKTGKYISPVSDFLAHCQLPNLFHFVVRIKSVDEITDHLMHHMSFAQFNRLSKREYFIEEQLSRIYSNLFSTYAKHYNFFYGRKGTLFTRPFERKLISSTEELHSIINEVHWSPVQSGHRSFPSEWNHSSYNEIAGMNSSLVNFQEVLDLFGGMENFLSRHTMGRQKVAF